MSTFRPNPENLESKKWVPGRPRRHARGGIVYSSSGSEVVVRSRGVPPLTGPDVGDTDRIFGGAKKAISPAGSQCAPFSDMSTCRSQQ